MTNLARIVPLDPGGWGIIAPGQTRSIGSYHTPQAAARIARLNGWEVEELKK